MPIKIKNVEFLGGAADYANLPTNDLPEVAFVGRSNVGKSTLINRLTNRKKLARTSSTPGRTTEINFFKVSLIQVSDENEIERNFVLVDLPGFGYAKFAKEQRESLSKLTVNFIKKRQQLSTICLLNDGRREPEADELAIRDLTFAAEKHLLIVLTKIDKLNQKEKALYPKKIAEAYNLEINDLILAGEKTSPENLWQRIITLAFI